MANQSWSEKMAEVRKRDAARRKEKLRAEKAARVAKYKAQRVEKERIRKLAAAKRRRSSVSGTIVNDAFDVFSQLVGVTNEWTGTGKKKGRK